MTGTRSLNLLGNGESKTNLCVLVHCYVGNLGYEYITNCAHQLFIQSELFNVHTYHTVLILDFCVLCLKYFP